MGTNNTVTVLEETIYSDGSGVCGLYVVYGTKFSAIRNGDNKITVTPLGLSSGYRGGRAKGIVKSAVRILENRLAGCMVG